MCKWEENKGWQQSDNGSGDNVQLRKSFITAGLCRVFKQDGYKVAPFKSQNMALNSYITKDGLEIGGTGHAGGSGRIAPTVEMNPILLKPTSNIGSQIIVNGEVRGNMKAYDYYNYKNDLMPQLRHHSINCLKRMTSLSLRVQEALRRLT